MFNKSLVKVDNNVNSRIVVFKNTRFNFADEQDQQKFLKALRGDSELFTKFEKVLGANFTKLFADNADLKSGQEDSRARDEQMQETLKKIESKLKQNSNESDLKQALDNSAKKIEELEKEIERLKNVGKGDKETKKFLALVELELKKRNFKRYHEIIEKVFDHNYNKAKESEKQAKKYWAECAEAQF